jgi:uncharacterized membrane-anchored protein
MAGMAANERRLIGIFLLVLVTLAGLEAVYWLLFFVWRTAADPSTNSLWWPRIYIWFAASVGALAGWIALLVWILKARKAN